MTGRTGSRSRAVTDCGVIACHIVRRQFGLLGCVDRRGGCAVKLSIDGSVIEVLATYGFEERQVKKKGERLLSNLLLPIVSK